MFPSTSSMSLNFKQGSFLYEDDDEEEEDVKMQHRYAQSDDNEEEDEDESEEFEDAEGKIIYDDEEYEDDFEDDNVVIKTKNNKKLKPVSKNAVEVMEDGDEDDSEFYDDDEEEEGDDNANKDEENVIATNTGATTSSMNDKENTFTNTNINEQEYEGNAKDQVIKDSKQQQSAATPKYMTMLSNYIKNQQISSNNAASATTQAVKPAQDDAKDATDSLTTVEHIDKQFKEYEYVSRNDIVDDIKSTHKEQYTSRENTKHTIDDDTNSDSNKTSPQQEEHEEGDSLMAEGDDYEFLSTYLHDPRVESDEEEVVREYEGNDSFSEQKKIDNEEMYSENDNIFEPQLSVGEVFVRQENIISAAVMDEEESLQARSIDKQTLVVSADKNVDANQKIPSLSGIVNKILKKDNSKETTGQHHIPQVSPSEKYVFDSVSRINDDEESLSSITHPEEGEEPNPVKYLLLSPPPPLPPLPPVDFTSQLNLDSPTESPLFSNEIGAANVESSFIKNNNNLTTQAANAASAAAHETKTTQISITEKLNRTALKIKIMMLKEQTKDLYSSELVSTIFGEDEDNPITPTPEMRELLKNTIDAELTVKRFMDYKKVVDVDTAELFIKDKKALEDISRKHIMSNPLLSSVDFDLILPSSFKKQKQYEVMGEVSDDPAVAFAATDGLAAAVDHQQLESSSDAASVVSSRSYSHNRAHATDSYSSSSSNSLQVSLYHDLTDILYNKPEERGEKKSVEINHALRLSSRISFIKKLIAFKMGNLSNISKMLNLSSFIIKQAIDTVSGGNHERVLTNGAVSNKKTGEYGSNSINNIDMNIATVDFVFGALKGGVNGVIERTCVSIAKTSTLLGIPIAMVDWPQEFKSTQSYERTLRDSIIRFKNSTNVPLSFVLESIFDSGDNNNNTTIIAENKTATTQVSPILSEQEKAKLIRDMVLNNECSTKNMMFALFSDRLDPSFDSKRTKGDYNNINSRTMADSIPQELFFQNISCVIEQRNRLTDNLLGGLVDYLDNNKLFLSKILKCLFSNVSMAATMYYMKSSSKKSNKRKSEMSKSNRMRKTSSDLINSGRSSSSSSISNNNSNNSNRNTFLSSHHRRKHKRGVCSLGVPTIAEPRKIISVKSARKRNRFDILDAENVDDIEDDNIFSSEMQKLAFDNWDNENSKL